MLSLRYIALGIARTTAAPEPRATDAAAFTAHPPAAHVTGSTGPPPSSCRLGERLTANAGRCVSLQSMQNALSFSPASPTRMSSFHAYGFDLKAVSVRLLNGAVKCMG